MDPILAEEAVDGGTADLVQWTLTDHLNTVRDIAKYDPQTGTTTVVNHLVYDAFGKVTAETNSDVESLFLFTARPFDPATGLQNNLHRWYDPRVGRWLSEDPVQADVNLYRYASNGPTLYVDPSGLRRAASPFEYVAGAMILRITGPRDGAPETGDMLSSDMTLTGQSVVAEFLDDNGCCLCTKVGFVQIAKSRLDITMGSWGPSVIWLDFWGNRNWFLDGGLPYKGRSFNPCESISPKLPTGGELPFTDLPGLRTGSYWFGSNVHYFSQIFETHLVCLEGSEKGATYGGVQWGHFFTIKPEFYVGSSIDKYSVNRWATRIGAPSPEFKKLVGAALGVARG